MSKGLDFKGIFILAGFITIFLLVGESVINQSFEVDIGLNLNFDSAISCIGFYWVSITLLIFFYLILKDYLIKGRKQSKEKQK